MRLWAVLERVDTMSLNLMQYFRRREENRARRLLTASPSIWAMSSTNNAPADAVEVRPHCLGGLEVSYSGSGWAVNIAPGVMVAPNPSPQTLTRPASWSGRNEADDDAYMSAELGAVASVSPPTPPSGATTGYEWWIVYVTPANAAVESDSNRKVFDQNPASPTFGQFIAASSTIVVMGHKLSVAVTRGGANMSLASVLLPSGAIPIARIFVPSGATDHTQSLFFDCRPLLHIDPGPNVVEGWWCNPQSVPLSSPYTNQPVFRGQVRARIGGEWVAARVYNGFDVTSLLDPTATWGTAGIAWVYLTKVRGTAHRLVRHGAYAVGSNPSFASDFDVIDGGLVISSTPPLVGLITLHAAGSPLTAGRWDLRPNAPLQLSPIAQASGSTIPTLEYGGLTVEQDDAICIGFIPYTSVVSGVPQLRGPVFCRDGWHFGDGISSSSAAAELGSFNAPTLPAASASYTWTPVTLPDGIHSLPYDAVRVAFAPQLDTATATLGWSFTDFPPDILEHPAAFGGSYYTPPRVFMLPTAEGAGKGVTPAGIAKSFGGNIVSMSPELVAVRFPYDDDLVTP